MKYTSDFNKIYLFCFHLVITFCGRHIKFLSHICVFPSTFQPHCRWEGGNNWFDQWLRSRRDMYYSRQRQCKASESPPAHFPSVEIQKAGVASICEQTLIAAWLQHFIAPKVGSYIHIISISFINLCYMSYMFLMVLFILLQHFKMPVNAILLNNFPAFY